jgi:hypothetical protein
MGATELQRNCPEMQKTLGKPRLTIGNLNTSAADPIDSDLATIVHSWPALDTAVKQSSLEMISRWIRGNKSSLMQG